MKAVAYLISEINKIRFYIISDTIIKGRYTLRVAITNHRSKRGDFDYIYSLVKELGERLLPEVKKSK